MKDIQFMWNGGNTRRFHTTPTLTTDTVGHHSYNVACVIMHLRFSVRVELLRAALKHDMAEHIVGDMPAPAKRMLPDYARGTFREVFGGMEEDVGLTAGVKLNEDLTEEELWLLKFADVIDGMRFCIQERAMGNKLIAYAYHNFRDYASQLLADGLGLREPQDSELFHYMQKEWRHADS